MATQQDPGDGAGKTKRSFWKSFPGVLTGIAAVIASVTGLYQVINSSGRENRNGGETIPPPPPRGVNSGNWAGSWTCRSTGHDMVLTITGHGQASSLRGSYQKAWADQPAREEYTIKDVQPEQVSGDYLYFDANPNVGYDGRPGVWKGEWVMTFGEQGFRLVRLDHTSGWRGEYDCSRNGGTL